VTAAPENESERKEFSKGRTVRHKLTYLFWLVPIAAAIVAGVFFYTNLASKGPELQIEFDDARGLEKGKSELKYRGVTLGKVDKVTLTHDRRHAVVTIALKESGESVAREGSIFWIVKPRVGLQQIRGLATIVSGSYVTVEPGEGKEQHKFRGLSHPALAMAKEPTLRIVLMAERLGSQKRGTPVLYRGVEIGEVYQTDLGPESQTVRILVDIKKKYAPLVRMNSKFWNAGGINMNIGLSGVAMSAQSAQAVVAGAIALSTPETPDKDATDGTAFRLYDKPQNDWLGWAPAIRLHHRHAYQPYSDDEDEP